MTETTIKGGIEIEVTTILKTVNYRDNPIMTAYYEMTINGNAVGSNEMNQNQVDWYTENYKEYIDTEIN
tara:strand:- start:156 stop:362 length:207 start_codon:yes stop_codon:yes gene_type:complete